MCPVKNHDCDFSRGKFWHTYQQLESRLNEISRYILFDRSNNSTYSEVLAEFLFSVGSSIDTFFRKMSDCPDIAQHRKSIGITFDSSKLKMNNYRDIFEDYFELSENHLSVPFGLGKTQDFYPFKNFSKTSPVWWRAYNNIKHDYYENISDANLENVLNGLGGLLILNLLHHCSNRYLINLGIFRDQNGIVSIRDAETAFTYTQKGTQGYNRSEGEFMYVRTNVYVFIYRNFEVI